MKTIMYLCAAMVIGATVAYLGIAANGMATSYTKGSQNYSLPQIPTSLD